MKYGRDYLQDLGYSLDVWKDSNGFWNSSVTINGKTVAFASFTYDYIPSEHETHLVEGDLKGWELFVDPDHRRKKLATSMYLEVEKQSNKKIIPNFLTPDGENFHNNLDKLRRL